MSDLLTHAEYQALAARIDPPCAAFIDGRYRPGTGAKLVTTNPATGDVITEIAACGAEDVDIAVGKAREAFDQGVWAKQHPSERKDVLIRLCKLITRNRRELAVMESLDSGKPIRDCEIIDIPEVINALADDFNMEEVKMDKDTLKEYLISYCEETLSCLSKNSTEYDDFKNSIPIFTKWIMKKEHLRFYTTLNELKIGENPSVAFGYKDSETDLGETFVFIQNGLVREVQ